MRFTVHEAEDLTLPVSKSERDRAPVQASLVQEKYTPVRAQKKKKKKKAYPVDQKHNSPYSDFSTDEKVRGSPSPPKAAAPESPTKSVP